MIVCVCVSWRWKESLFVVPPSTRSFRNLAAFTQALTDYCFWCFFTTILNLNSPFCLSLCLLKVMSCCRSCSSDVSTAQREEEEDREVSKQLSVTQMSLCWLSSDRRVMHRLIKRCPLFSLEFGAWMLPFISWRVLCTVYSTVWRGVSGCCVGYWSSV